MKLWNYDFSTAMLQCSFTRGYTLQSNKNWMFPSKLFRLGYFSASKKGGSPPHFPTIVVATNKKRIPLLPFRVPNLSVVSNWLDHRPNLRPTSARLLSTSPAHKTVSMRRLKPSTRPTPMSGGIPKPARGPRHRGFIAVIQHPKGSGSPETNKWGLEV
jgi:hypothetical protein